MLERHAVPGNVVNEGRAPAQRLKRLAVEFPDEVHAEARYRFVRTSVPCWVPSGSENFEKICREVATELLPTVAAAL